MAQRVESLLDTRDVEQCPALHDLELEPVGGQASRLQGVTDPGEQTRVRKSAPGQVDRDPQRRGPGGGRLGDRDAACLAQHPSVELGDEVRLLGKRQEARRRDHAQTWVLPPHERLRTDNLIREYVDDRLVEDAQLVLLQRLLELALERRGVVRTAAWLPG